MIVYTLEREIFTLLHEKHLGFEEISSREIPSISCFAPTRKIRDFGSIYDWVHSGSTQFFMDPDKTEANLHRAESSYRREEGRVDSTKLLGAGGRFGRRHIQR